MNDFKCFFFFPFFFQYFWVFFLFCGLSLDMTSYSRRRPSENSDTESQLHIFQKYHGYPSKKLTCPEHLKFENLPKSVFKSICENISVKDIISLSSTCTCIEKKVKCNIYKHIRILDIDNIVDEDELIIQKHFGTFKDESLESETWWVYNNACELKSAKNILYFIYNIMINPAYGNFIETIEINPILKPSPWLRNRNDQKIKNSTVWLKRLDEFLTHDELLLIRSLPFYHPNLTLFDVLELLLNFTPNLQNLIVSRFSLSSVSRLLLKTPKLRQLKIMIHENDVFEELPLNILHSLKIFRLKFQENTEEILTQLAINFQNSNVFESLETLILKLDKTDFNYLTTPTWYSFFKPLIDNPNNMNIPIFKSLTCFELKDCFFDHDQYNIISNLSKVIPFNQIEKLSLQIYEYSHKFQRHSDCKDDKKLNFNNTVLSYLSPQLSSIKDITIKQTKNCESCQFDSLLNFLDKHKTLQKIWISVDSLNKENYFKLLKKLHNFKNLKKLALFDEFINDKLIRNLKSWFLFENGVNFDIFKNFESESLRQDIDPLFNCYRINEFKKFNEEEQDLLVLFWQQFLNEFKLESLMNKNGVCGATELKLFGYNFKIDRYRKVIMLYISKDVGFVDVKYFV